VIRTVVGAAVCVAAFAGVAAACPPDVPRSAAVVSAGLLDGPLVDALEPEELRAMERGRAVVHRLCVPGFSTPRFQVFRLVRAHPETVAAVVFDPVAFAERLPHTFAVEAASLLDGDPARERPDVAAAAVRMRYWLMPPFVAEDYTLRFVAGPYLRGVRTAPTFGPDSFDSFAFKWIRQDARIADVLDGNARFEPYDGGRMLLRYETFVAFAPPGPDRRYTPRPPGVEDAIRAVVRRIGRTIERAQAVRDDDAAQLRGRRAALRRSIDDLVRRMNEAAADLAAFPSDEAPLLAWPGPTE